MRSTRVIIGFAAALIASTALATPALAGKEDNSVRVATQIVPTSLDPYFTISNLSRTLTDSIWDTLIFRDPETGDLKGNLASAWRWIDVKTLELELRRGVKFHDGTGFDADDVVYTFNFVANPENRAVNISNVRWIDKVEKIDPYRVRIIAKEPFPAALAYLASPRLAIHAHAYYARVGPKGMNEHPIGTGPYRVVEHALGKFIRLERNPDYFRDSPKSMPHIDKVEMRFIPDGQTRVAEVVAGGVDLIMDVARDQAAQLEGVRDLKIVSGETTNYAILRMNTLPSTPARELRDLRVRQAIAHAIDRDTMVKFLVGGGARVLHAECHPSDFGCVDESVRRYGYDPALSRQLLADAGYKNGFSIDFYAGRDRNQAEAVINYLRAVGINARLRFVQAGALIAVRRSGRMTLTQGTWSSGSNFDVSNTVSPYHEFSPDDINRDPEIRDLLVKADSAMNPDIRKETYAKAFALIAERAYVVPLYSLPVYYVATKDLVFQSYNDETLRFWDMSYK